MQPFFPELRKIEKCSQSKIQKSQDLFMNWGKLESTAKTRNFESMDELGKVRSKFEFH